MVLSTKTSPTAHNPFVKGKWMRKSERKSPRPAHTAPTEIVEQKSQIDFIMTSLAGKKNGGSVKRFTKNRKYLISVPS